MTIAPGSITDHLDFLVTQPFHEREIVRDLVFAVLAFNAHGRGERLQIGFPLFADPKVTRMGALGPCIRVTGPAEKLYVLTLRYEISAHLRAGRAMTLVRDNEVVLADRFERFGLLGEAQAVPRIATPGVRPIVVSGQPRIAEMAARSGTLVRDEALLVGRGETDRASDGTIDLLGFSGERTLPVIR